MMIFVNADHFVVSLLISHFSVYSDFYFHLEKKNGVSFVFITVNFF